MSDDEQAEQTVATIEVRFTNSNVDVKMAATEAKSEAKEIVGVSNYDIEAEVTRVERRNTNE